MTIETQPEQILIVGAGVAGLFAAMMLAGPGRTVTILERDPPPDSTDANHAFAHWRRRGVGQLRHSHAFLARLINIVRERHPALIEQLIAAGCREVTLADLLPSTLKDRYTPEPGDASLSILMSRRTTLELIVRRYVESLAGVSIRADAFVAGFLFAEGATTPIPAQMPTPIPRIVGVRTEAGERLAADLVVDSTGRASLALDLLAEAGVQIEESGEPAGILYYTRHWRLKPGQSPPPRNGSPGAGDLGYIKFGLFEADNGWFSVTLAVPEVEVELRQTIVRPEVFDAACNALPGIAPWIEPHRATAETKVFAMGDLRSRWRRLVNGGRPAVLGLVLIGDSLIQSNPLYGRGTAFAAVQAEALAKAVSAGRDAAARVVLYDSLVEQALKPFYDDMQDQDRSAIRRAAAARAGEPVSFRQQLMRSFIRDGAGLALRDDLAAFRAALRAFHMLDLPRAWLREPRHMGVMLRTWARGKKRKAHLYPARMGPERAEMLALLGLVDPAADDLAA
jgi:2-polyprenyl-6-methoxyphenol hydroxylase-like FAD-dependent oxidoreductase